MDKPVLYLIGDGFRPEEYFFSKEEVEKGGFKVITAGKNKVVPARDIPKMPKSTNADITFDEIDTKNLDKDFIAIVVPGGTPGWENLYNNDKVLEIIRSAAEKGMLVASICASPAVLAKSGILKGKTATIYPGMTEYLKKGECNPKDTDKSFEGKTVIVKDGNIITGNGPWASRDFGRAIVKELKKRL